MKELEFEHTEHSRVAFYKVVPIKAAWGETGGVREELGYHLPCLKSFVHQPFNPSTGGGEVILWISTIIEKGLPEPFYSKLLILVLIEWKQNSFPHPSQKRATSLNPYFNGMLIKSRSSTRKKELQTCLNPYYNGTMIEQYDIDCVNIYNES